MVAISETLHRELEAMGLPIGVTVACPALVRTPMTEAMFALAHADDDVLTEHLPTHLSVEQLRALLQRMIANPMEPDAAAERILAAIETDRLYALTHGDVDGSVRHRAEGILAALHNQGWSDNHWRDSEQ